MKDSPPPDPSAARTRRPPRPDEPDDWCISSADLADGDFRPEWLIRGVLAKSESAIVAGPSKSLKTSLLVDMAVSLATGQPFLGRFAVPHPLRVLVVSGESGMRTLQETATRVAAAKGWRLRDVGQQLRWRTELPSFSDPDAIAEFVAKAVSRGVSVAVIDPLYLALGGGADPRNLFEMGERLQAAIGPMLAAGVTPVIAHHANRNLPVGGPMELQHLQFSGLEQFARQWVLINRQVPYAGDGSHDLIVRVGGSAGHAGLYGVRIEEGVTDDDFGGRRWVVTVRTAAEVRADRDAAKEAKKGQQLGRDETDVLAAIDAAVAAGQAGATVKAIRRSAPRLSNDKVKGTLERLEAAGQVARVDVEVQSGSGKKARQKAAGYRRTDPSTQCGECGEFPGSPHSSSPHSEGGREWGELDPLRGGSSPVPRTPSESLDT